MTHDTTWHKKPHNMTWDNMTWHNTTQHVNRSGQVRRSTWQHNNMTTWQHDNMTPWQHDNATIWQQVRSGHNVLSDQLRTSQVSKGQVRSRKVWTGAAEETAIVWSGTLRSVCYGMVHVGQPLIPLIFLSGQLIFLGCLNPYTQFLMISRKRFLDQGQSLSQ